MLLPRELQRNPLIYDYLCNLYFGAFECHIFGRYTQLVYSFFAFIRNHYLHVCCHLFKHYRSKAAAGLQLNAEGFWAASNTARNQEMAIREPARHRAVFAEKRPSASRSWASRILGLMPYLGEIVPIIKVYDFKYNSMINYTGYSSLWQLSLDSVYLGVMVFCWNAALLELDYYRTQECYMSYYFKWSLLFCSLPLASVAEYLSWSIHTCFQYIRDYPI